MSEKIAVICPTIEIWDMVRKKLGSNRDRNRWDKKKQNTCLEISPCRDEYSSKSYFMSLEYTIISAAEYLSEGGKDAMEFKVGDRVECIEKENYSQLEIGGIYTISYIDEDDVGIDGAEEDEWPIAWFKLSTQTTKENNMNISDNILEVFENSKDAKKVAARFGSEYGDTTRDLLALKRDKDDLLAIIEAEEKAEKDK